MMTEEHANRAFHILTFGCQMNVADSSTLAARLVQSGLTEASDAEHADLIVVNTCSVRQKSEQRALGRLSELLQFKRKRPRVRIAVVGCMAQRLGRDLIERLPGVDYVLGPDRLFELPRLLEHSNGAPRVLTSFGENDPELPPPAPQTSFSSFVTISRGCDNYCTYCVVPYVRGQLRHHSSQNLVQAIRRLADRGVVEVTLLGQNVNSYRCGETTFPDLLRQVARNTGVQRIRFMTSHPKDFSRRLVEVLASEPNIMPHIHLPLQSGSDRILEKMGRGYTTERFLQIVAYLRSQLDYVSLTTDLIVGFPTETEEEFQQTLAMVRKIRFDAAFMFRYSVRPGTGAAEMPDTVPEDEKIRRLKTLITVQKRLAYECNQREVGAVLYSLVEGHSRRSADLWRARTEGNKTVLFEAQVARPGQVLPIRVTSADSFTLHGNLEETA